MFYRSLSSDRYLHIVFDNPMLVADNDQLPGKWGWKFGWIFFKIMRPLPASFESLVIAINGIKVSHIFQADKRSQHSIMIPRKAV